MAKNKEHILILLRREGWRYPGKKELGMEADKKEDEGVREAFRAGIPVLPVFTLKDQPEGRNDVTIDSRGRTISIRLKPLPRKPLGKKEE